MAVLAVGAAGAALGWGLTGTLIGAQIGWGLGLWLGSGLFTEKQHVEGQQISNLNVTGVGPGQSIPWIQGYRRTAGYLWWASTKRAIPHTQTSGGKGGAPEVETTTYTYDVDLLYGLTSNKMAYLVRVWADGKLVFTNLATESAAKMTGEDPTDSGFIARMVSNIIASVATETWDAMTFYDGSLDQMPDPTYEGAVGVGQAPAFRGRSYVVFKNFHTDGSGRVPLLTFEVASRPVGEDTLAITPFYTLPDDNKWTDLVGTTKNKIIPTSKGRKMWYFLQPEYVGAFYQGATQVGLFDHATLKFDFIEDFDGGLFPIIGVSKSGETWKDRVYFVQENGSGLFCNGHVYMMEIDGTLHDLGFPPCFLNSEGTFGVTDVVEGRQSNPLYPDVPGELPELEREFGWTTYLIRERNGFGPAVFSCGSNPNTLGSATLLSGNTFPTQLGFNNKFFFGANRILDRVYVSTLSFGGACRGLAWIQVPSNTITYIKTYTVDYAPQMLVGWDEYLYGAADPTKPSTIQKLDRDGNLIGEVDIGAGRTPLTLVDDEFGRLYVSSQTAPAERTVTRILKDTMTIDGTVALIDAADDLLGGAALEGVGIFVVRSSGPDDLDSVRIISGPNQLIGERLYDVVTRLLLRAGYTADQFDVSQLLNITKLVHSLAVMNEPTRQPLEMLMATHYWGLTVSDKLYARPRGGVPVAIIPFEDLAARPEGEGDPEPLPIRTPSDLERPAQLGLGFVDVYNDHQAGLVYSPIRPSKTKNINLTNITLGMPPAEAKGIVDTWQVDQIISATTSEISLLGKYSFLEPCDPILVTDRNGNLLRFRVVKKTDTYPILSFDLAADDPTILKDEGIVGADTNGSIDVALPIDTLMELLDLPTLRDSDNFPGGYVIARGNGTPWAGAGIFSSLDNVDYVRIAVVTETGGFGTCTTILDDWDGPPVFDERIGVMVNTGTATLSSLPRTTLLENKYANLCAIGVNGRWELCQFRNASLLSASPNIYWLTGLVRGAFGTEWAMKNHVAGEKFVLLSEFGVRRFNVLPSQLGIEQFYKGVTLGRRLSTADPVSFTLTGVGLKPYSPGDLRAAYDTSTGDITLTPYRRTRLAARTISTLGQSIPLGEETESYKVEFYSDDTYTTLVATRTWEGPTYVYTAAQQTEDFGAPQTSLFIRLYQLSAVVGAGYPLEIAL